MADDPVKVDPKLSCLQGGAFAPLTQDGSPARPAHAGH